MFESLLLFSVFQNFFFLTFLINARNPNNKTLLFFFLRSFLADLLLFVLGKMSQPSLLHEWLGVLYNLIALSRPALLFYLLYSLAGKPMPRVYHLLWMIPIVCTIMDFVFKAWDPDFYNLGFNQNWYLNLSFLFKFIVLFLLFLQLRIFADKPSTDDHHKVILFYWGKYFLYFNIMAFILSQAYLSVTLLNNRLFHIDSEVLNYSEETYNSILYSFSAVFLFVFGYLSLRNPSVFQSAVHEHPLELRFVEIVVPADEKQFSRLIHYDPEQISYYSKTLDRLLEEEKVYLDPELSLKKLSQTAQIPQRALSEFINSHYNKSYKELINGYRIQHASELLISDEGTALTMYAVACDSGFNSESVFYKLFKDQTGLTPRQYQEKHKSGILSPESN